MKCSGLCFCFVFLVLCCQSLADISVSPFTPTAADEVQITVTGTLGQIAQNCGDFIVAQSYSTNGQNIAINLVASTQVGVICVQVQAPHTFSITEVVGRLPAGQYQVTAQITNGSPPPTSVPDVPNNALTFSVLPTTYYVATTGDDNNDGSQTSPFATIQQAMDTALDGDTVLVADGTYTGAGNVDLNFNGEAITVKSVSGAASTIIDCQANARGVIFLSGETSASVWDGFTIRGGRAGANGGGAILCQNSSPTLTNCILTGNTADPGMLPVVANGGGISCISSSTIIINCLFIGNSVITGGGNGGGIACDNASPQVINCTFTENHATRGGAISSENGAAPLVKNTILWGDTATSGGTVVQNEVFLADSQSRITLTFSDVGGGLGAFLGDATAIANSTYQNNIETDPLFGNASSGLTYDLQPGSPCLSAGTSVGAPATDIVGRSRPSGSGVDIGAYEQDDDASLPVELSAFSGTITPDGVWLVWRTESETNNLGFHVYRSETKDGDYVRMTPTLINGHGTDSTPHDYGFLDDRPEEGKTYWYIIEDIGFSGVANRSDPIFVGLVPDIVLKVLPTDFALYQNYPNPFNPETWIPYDLAADAQVTLTIYDSRGQLARSLALGSQPAGSYLTKDRAAYWDGRSNTGEIVSSGIYYYHLRAGDFAATDRMLIVK